ncbi:MAG: hypothetical protein QOF48_1503, partial [Verrucomicrobiota bacterium]
VDLVITDIFMPEKDGLSTIRDFRQQFPNVILIAMSGQPDLAHSFFLAQQLGAQCVLEKPFDREKLLGAVADTLQAAGWRQNNPQRGNAGPIEKKSP